MINIILDSVQISSTKDLYEQLDSFLHFPDYFGYNLDALYDIISETNESVSLTIINLKKLEANLGNTYCQKLLQVFQHNNIITNIL